MTLTEALDSIDDAQVARHLLSALEKSLDMVDRYSTAIEDMSGEHMPQDFVIQGQRLAYAARYRLLDA